MSKAGIQRQKSLQRLSVRSVLSTHAGNTLVIRLVLATVIFAVSLIISMPDFVGIILLVLAPPLLPGTI